MTLMEFLLVTEHALLIEGHVGDAVHAELRSWTMTELKVRNPWRMTTSHRGFKVRSVQHSLIVGRSSRGGTVSARRGTKDLLINELQLTTQLITLPEGRVVDFILATALVGGGRGG